ncbi:hypothetical protein BT69DRAFT_1278823, partial [Atractiella rhizophila]
MNELEIHGRGYLHTFQLQKDRRSGVVFAITPSFCKTGITQIHCFLRPMVNSNAKDAPHFLVIPSSRGRISVYVEPDYALCQRISLTSQPDEAREPSDGMWMEIVVDLSTDPTRRWYLIAKLVPESPKPHSRSIWVMGNWTEDVDTDTTDGVVVVQFSASRGRCVVQELPTEILELIFSFLDLADSDSFWSTISAVCDKWKAIVSAYDGEPRSCREKLEKLSASPHAGRFWEIFDYRFGDLRCDIPFLLSQALRIRRIRISALPLKMERRAILTALSKLEHVQQLFFDNDYTPHQSTRGPGEPWNWGEVEELLLRSRWRANLQDLNLREIVCAPGQPPISAEALHLPSLRNLCLSQCHFPSPFGENLMQSSSHSKIERLEGFHDLSMEPYRFPTALSIAYLDHLTYLALDGVHDNSNLLPSDFFTSCMSNLHLVNNSQLTRVIINFCSLDFQDFIPFMAWYFGEERWANSSWKRCSLQVQLY